MNTTTFLSGLQEEVCKLDFNEQAELLNSIRNAIEFHVLEAAHAPNDEHMRAYWQRRAASCYALYHRLGGSYSFEDIKSHILENH